MMMSQFLLLLKLQSLLLLTVSSSLPEETLPQEAEAPPIAKPKCLDRCGEVKIPYPFGIGAGCYHNESYQIICNSSFHPPKLFLHSFHLEVIDIKLNRDSQTLLVWNTVHNICSNHKGGVAKTSAASSIDLRGSPYRFSSSNVFMVQGCGASVVLKNSGGAILTGCASICTNNTSKKNITNCYGVGCCQSSLQSDYADSTSGFESYEIGFHYETLLSFDTCNVVAGLLDSNSVTNFSGKLSSLGMLPTLLVWGGGYTAAEMSTSEIFSCLNDDTGFQMSCRCNIVNGYEGNPFLGCQLMGECQKCKYGCAAYNIGTRYHVCKKHQLFNRASVLGFSISTGSVILLLICYLLYRLVKRIKVVRQKAKFFKRNGGLLLQQQISSRDGIVDKTRIFGFCELEKATNNFNNDRILGQGGQGTVYKGMLEEDGRIAAIKKSRKVEKNRLEQFINEMAILSLINHRSVVKLLGCCLETEVPLLVYEFIPNGTLYQHIHDPSEDFHLTWKMRLQIAAESASALSYLHSSSSAPIYHRDIKSSNILLDDKYRAKVSDFGTSRAISIEQTHVTTYVQGTYGYLDPQYFQSNQFTEKSDVYSFGVVLAELITARKPISSTGSGGWISLATEFLFQMENSCLFDIVDTRISEEAKEEELVIVANLAKQCLNMNGKQRPTMKEIAVLLDGIRSPNVSKPKEPECLKSDCVVVEHNSPFITDTSFFYNSPSTSLSIESQPLMASN